MNKIIKYKYEIQSNWEDIIYFQTFFQFLFLEIYIENN